MLKEFKKYATSELLFRAKSKHINNEGILKLLYEISERFKQFHVQSIQLSKFLEKETEILEKGKHRLQSDKLLFSNPIIQDGMSMANFNFDDMTFSELVYLSEEADRIYQSGKHGSLKSETVKIVTENKSAIMGESAVMNECIKRLKEMGLSDIQVNQLIENEKAIIQRVHDEKKINNENNIDDEQR